MLTLNADDRSFTALYPGSPDLQLEVRVRLCRCRPGVGPTWATYLQFLGVSQVNDDGSVSVVNGPRVVEWAEHWLRRNQSELMSRIR